MIMNIKCFFISLFSIFIGCGNANESAYNFSNFNNTEAEVLSQAVESNDIKGIREEILNKKINVNFRDSKYETTLLSLSIVNNKKDAFKELLILGANPNLYNKSCENPLTLSININNDLFFLKTLLKYELDLTPHFFKKKCDFYAYDPILETILIYNDLDNYKYGLEILRLLIESNKNLNFKEFNDAQNYEHNIIFFCLKSRNISALKYFIVDRKIEFPDDVYIDSTVLWGYEGFVSLTKILEDKTFIFENSEFREKAKKDILEYLYKNEE